LSEFDRILRKIMPKEINKQKALSALLKSSSVAEAAEISELSEKTLRRFLQDEEFRTEYQTLRRELVTGAINQMQNLATEAVERLKDLQYSENPTVALRASQIIYENSVKGLETIDILTRLEALEKKNEIN
jgi:hypothetical protein